MGGSKTSVLFLHSQDGFGADSAIHGHLMRWLDRDRFDVHLACSRGDGRGDPPSLVRFREIPDVHVRPTRFAPGFRHRSRQDVLRGAVASVLFPVDFAALALYMRRENIRIVHSTDRPRDAVYSVTLANLTGAKSVVHVHVAWSEHYSAPARWGVRSADAVFGISRFVSSTVVRTGSRPERVHTILNGIDPTRWDPGIDGRAIRREFGIPEHAPLLASVSRLFSGKGQRDLLKALCRVRESVPEVRLLVVGADAVDVHGGSFTAELKVLASELGLGDRVVFTGERRDIPQIMAACDVYSMPSWEEPFGLVFLEAMAMKKPVVALSDGGTPEVVEHGRSGLLAAHGDIEAFAAHVVALLQDPALRARMGEYGRKRVLEYFNAGRMARDVGAAYEAILAAPLHNLPSVATSSGEGEMVR